jgi:hypothetical protein
LQYRFALIAAVIISAVLVGFLQYDHYAYALSRLGMDIAIPTFFSIQGDRIREAEAGQQIIIIESIRNTVYLDEDKPLVVIVEVRDQDDVTIYLAYQTATVRPNDTYNLGISWMIPPDAASGTSYQVRTFALTTFSLEADVLSTVQYSGIGVK